jgi:transcriptional regulator with XRE-family HTH domain
MTINTDSGIEFLRALRRFLGLTQRQAAERMGISIVSWGRWECSMTRPSEEHVVTLAAWAKQPLEEIAPLFGY